MLDFEMILHRFDADFGRVELDFGTFQLISVFRWTPAVYSLKLKLKKFAKIPMQHTSTGNSGFLSAAADSKCFRLIQLKKCQNLPRSSPAPLIHPTSAISITFPPTP